MCKDLKNIPKESEESFLWSLAAGLAIIVLAPWLVSLMADALDAEAKIAAAKNPVVVERQNESSR